MCVKRQLWRIQIKALTPGIRPVACRGMGWSGGPGFHWISIWRWVSNWKCIERKLQYKWDAGGFKSVRFIVVGFEQSRVSASIRIKKLTLGNHQNQRVSHGHQNPLTPVILMHLLKIVYFKLPVLCLWFLMHLSALNVIYYESNLFKPGDISQIHHENYAVPIWEAVSTWSLRS